MSILDGADVRADYFVPSYTAGEAISAGDAVALDLTDTKIYKASASAWSYRINFIGVAMAGGSSGASIPVNDTSIIAEKTGLIANAMYYLSNTQGVIGTSSGTIWRRIGIATSSTRIKRPKNGTPVGDCVARALSSATAYAHLTALMAGSGGSGTFQLDINGTTIVSHNRGDVSAVSVTLLPDDTITWTASTANYTGITSPAVRILDR